MKRFASLIIFVAVGISITSMAQNGLSASDLQAQTIAAKSMAAMTGGVVVNDVALSGNVTAIAGSDNQTGTATLLATQGNSSRVELNLGSGKRTDIQNGSGGSSLGTWSTNDGPSKAYAAQNTATDASWFFPALGSIADPNAVLTLVGQEQRGGSAVYHLRSYRTNTISFVQQLSQMDFYLDAVSLLPVACTFNVHPDNDMNVNIPVEIDYSGYQSSNGVQVPMHIQRYIQGSLTLDLTLTSVSINSGLPQTEFAIQ
jgi:hypothetical protein